MFIAALFITAKTRKQSKCPPKDDWIKTHTHTHTVIVLSQREREREKEILTFATTWMGLEDVI